MVDLNALNARVYASGVKRTVLAQEIGVSQPTLRRKLRGMTPITANDIEAFGRVLNLSRADVTKIFFARQVN